MQLDEQMIAELRSLVEQIAVDQPTPAKRFLFEMIFGLCASGSVLLTEIGRKLPADISLHAVEKRLSRQLGSDRWDDEATLKRYVAWAAFASIIEPGAVAGERCACVTGLNALRGKMRLIRWWSPKVSPKNNVPYGLTNLFPALKKPSELCEVICAGGLSKMPIVLLSKSSLWNQSESPTGKESSV